MLALFAGKRHSGEENKKPFTFDDMFNPAFSPDSLSIQWGPQGNYYTYTDTETCMCLSEWGNTNPF